MANIFGITSTTPVNCYSTQSKIIITTHQTAPCHINESKIILIDKHSKKSLDGFSRRLRSDTTVQEPYPSKFEQLKRA